MIIAGIFFLQPIAEGTVLIYFLYPCGFTIYFCYVSMITNTQKESHESENTPSKLIIHIHKYYYSEFLINYDVKVSPAKVNFYQDEMFLNFQKKS